jgi:hypothetical protein
MLLNPSHAGHVRCQTVNANTFAIHSGLVLSLHAGLVSLHGKHKSGTNRKCRCTYMLVPIGPAVMGAITSTIRKSPRRMLRGALLTGCLLHRSISTRVAGSTPTSTMRNLKTSRHPDVDTNQTISVVTCIFPYRRYTPISPNHPWNYQCHMCV